MKKTLLIVLLIPLILVEGYLCTTFLPMEWQHTIDTKIPRILPASHGWTSITHPNLDLELEQVLREHIWLRIAVYAVTLILLLANTWVIRWIWRLLRVTQSTARIV